jgi:transposase/predicted nucleic acid-binding Zn finger protein
MEAMQLTMREMRGLAIVKDKGKAIRQIVADKFLVPSQTLASGGYVVDVTTEQCTCPDWIENNVAGAGHNPLKCKHVIACLIVSKKLELPDGSTVMTQQTVSMKRDWPKYNRAQINEVPRVAALLRTLCDGIVQPPYKGNGRPSLPLADVVYSVTMRVFTGLSVRRVTGEIQRCFERGHISRVPSFPSIFRYMESPTLTPLLQVLIAESAEPLIVFEKEKQYAIDATGFATGVYGSWFEHKHGKKTEERRKQKYVKAHVMGGTHTHVVTWVEPTEGHVSDTEMLPDLVSNTAQRVQLGEISADKGYLTKVNADMIAAYGAVPYIAWKDNSTGTKGPAAWNSMWHSFCADKDLYMSKYHRRSNIETVMQMVKTKFGSKLNSRTLTAQYNEILLKYFCHNLSCIAMAVDTLGIEPKFDRLFGVQK